MAIQIKVNIMTGTDSFLPSPYHCNYCIRVSIKLNKHQFIEKKKEQLPYKNPFRSDDKI